MTNNKVSQFPCPLCKTLTAIIGTNSKGKKIGSCGCTWKFKQSKSSKDMSKKYIKTEYGLELVKETDAN